MRSISVLVLVVLVIALVACSNKPHVRLGPLPPDLTPDQRVQTYYELHASSERTTVTRSCNGRGGCSTSVERTLFLANGTEVHHPEDLLPMVAADSTAARSIQASLRSRETGRKFTLVGVAGMLAFAFVGASVLSDDGDISPGNKLILLGGGAAAIVGSFGAYYYYQKAADEHGDANEQYNAGLATQLRICTNVIYVVPCEAQ